MEEDLLSWVCMALMRIGTRMATGFDQHFSRLGITQSQFRILLAVWQVGGENGITPSALADYLLIERGTVSVLTNRMVTQGWLARAQGENRRSYRLVLTGNGAQLLQASIPRAEVLAERTLAEIPLEQLEQLRVNLEKIEARLRHMELPEP